MNRKAIGTEVIIALTIGVIFLIGGVGWLTKVGKVVDDSIIDQMCTQSVLMNSKLRNPVTTEQINPINCPTKFVQFTKANYVVQYEYNPTDKTGSAITRPPVNYKDAALKPCTSESDADKKEACMFRNINGAMANEIARCWNMFQQGNARVFSDYTKDRQCVVCSVLSFNDEMVAQYKSKGAIGMSFSEKYPDSEDYSLDNYMKKESIIKYTATQNVYDYTLDLVDQSFKRPYYDYDVSHEWAVVFIAVNKHNIDNLGTGLWNKIKASLNVPVDAADSENFVNTLEFIPNSDVAKRCDTWG